MSEAEVLAALRAVILHADEIAVRLTDRDSDLITFYNIPTGPWHQLIAWARDGAVPRSLPYAVSSSDR
jgi:hypothetical protein